MVKTFLTSCWRRDERPDQEEGQQRVRSRRAVRTVTQPKLCDGPLQHHGEHRRAERARRRAFLRLIRA
jgi:hypothetical protein